MENLEDILGLKHSSLELPRLHPYYFTYQKAGKKIIIFPTLHDQVNFSQLVWELMESIKPQEVLLELPQELERQLLRAIDRLPIPSVLHNNQLSQQEGRTLTPNPAQAYIIHPGEPLYWLGYLARREGIPVHFMDYWHPEAYQSWYVPMDYPALASIGWYRFWSMGGGAVLYRHLENDVHLSRSLNMANRILELAEERDGPILVSCGAAHWPVIARQLTEDGFTIEGKDPIPGGIRQLLADISWVGKQDTPPMKWSLADIHPHTIHLVISDLPFIVGNMVGEPDEFDYLEAIRQLLFEAEKIYGEKFDDQISPATYQRLFQFLRNLGRIQGVMIPGLYNLVAAAKGMVDDDYAFEVYRTAIMYPFIPREDQKLEEMIKFVPNEDQGEIIKFAFNRRFKRPVLKKVRGEDEYDDLDPIPEEQYPGQWQEIWDKYAPWGMVSYPPEDEYIEHYLAYLRKRVKEILMEEQASSKEFESSMEDGIDWRETMRHYHERKIFVKKFPKQVEEVGALVIQFLEDPFDEQEYSYYTTLFAEHDQESHISVITTPPGEIMVGPGITRVKYAAIVSQFPPDGMPYLIPQENTETKLRLIFAAMQMSLTRIIGFVAKRPPTPAQRHFAAENGFRLIYLPMDQLTKVSLHRLRTMHLLAHRDLRDIAREYIGF